MNIPETRWFLRSIRTLILSWLLSACRTMDDSSGTRPSLLPTMTDQSRTVGVPTLTSTPPPSLLLEPASSPSNYLGATLDILNFSAANQTMTLEVSATLRSLDAPTGEITFHLPAGIIATTDLLTTPISFVADQPVHVSLNVHILQPGTYIFGATVYAHLGGGGSYGSGPMCYVTINAHGTQEITPTPLPLCPKGPMLADDGIHPTWTPCQYNP